MRMIEVNIMNTIYSIELSKKYGVKKYFCVSTDKAANPANMMGASKRIMEFFLKKLSNKQEISSARFANVAFSDGSLLKGFQDRLYKRQPISVPRDVKRFFITPRESGQLCLISALKGNNNEIFFPKEKKDFQLTSFINLLERFIKYNGFEIKECSSEEEARVESNKLIKHGLWPCYFFNSDTTGEKLFEEFYTENEEVDLDSFTSIGIVKNSLEFDDKKLEDFLSFVSNQRKSNQIAKKDIVNEFKNLIENFDYEDKEKYLDNRM
jgi:FlaA1/EpsC-like NDP-sugar epimerase